MKKDIINELEEMDSSLSEYKKQDVFSVSDEYFEKMQSSVLSKLDSQSDKVRIVDFYSRRRLMGIAAAFIVLFGAMFLIKQYNQPKDELASDDIYQYLKTNIDDIDEADFALYLDEADLDILTKTSYTLDELEDYLQDNIDDISEEDLKNLF